MNNKSTGRHALLLGLTPWQGMHSSDRGVADVQDRPGSVPNACVLQGHTTSLCLATVGKYTTHGIVHGVHAFTQNA
jgi:hypothetical protein